MLVQSTTSVSALTASNKPARPARASLAERAAADEVTLSRQGQLLGRLPELLLPTRENVDSMAASAGADLNAALGTADRGPADLRFAMDSSGKLQITGDEADVTRARSLLDAQPELARKIQNTLAIASHAAAIAPAVRFDAEYRQAQGNAESQAVLAKYQSLLNGAGKTPEVALRFDGSARVEVT